MSDEQNHTYLIERTEEDEQNIARRIEQIQKELTSLKGYRYHLQGYLRSHHELVLIARHPDQPEQDIQIFFTFVDYLQMPTTWTTGDFRLGTEAELQMIYDRMNTDQYNRELLSLFMNLVVAETKNGFVYILGILMRAGPDEGQLDYDRYNPDKYPLKSKTLETTKGLTDLKGYYYYLKNYNHPSAKLNVGAEKGEKESKETLCLSFEDVYYLQMPTTWTNGSFRLGTEAERQSVLDRIDVTLPEKKLRQVSLYVAEANNREPGYILGRFVGMKQVLDE